MSKSQFPRSLFPQFTEEELQKASKISHSSVNWTEYNKWVKAGEPFKEHDELMSMNQKLKNGSTQRRLAGKYINFIFTLQYSFVFMYNKIKLIIFFKEPNNITLSEPVNKEMELVLTRMTGRRIKKPKPPLVMKVNIVVKALDSIKFPTLAIYMNQILQDLQKDGILNDVIGLEQVREFKYDKKSDEMKLVRPNIGFYNVVPKESYIYTLTLTNNHFLMLRHLEERWFRCLAYLINHDSYLEFLNIFFTNKTTP
ncbi:uncharacterized protein OCT59_009903 [Rhizophagus irregularis]|uniref:uncharacterized protein n=1 Tax=Rhizophagus irregularis TaxID=588596 RepID=UPI0033277E79|nr:hypothetical protein OCT59_009903 [Rhizophagus irregularis]